jgi:hypothetical protein
MAYITQDQKKIINDALKVALKDFPSVKYSLSIQDHMKITCTIKQGPAGLTPKNGEDCNVNRHHIDKNYSGDAATILNAINVCLHIGHSDDSDVTTDYFDCSWYTGIDIGSWNKSFVTA